DDGSPVEGTGRVVPALQGVEDREYEYPAQFWVHSPIEGAVGLALGDGGTELGLVRIPGGEDVAAVLAVEKARFVEVGADFVEVVDHDVDMSGDEGAEPVGPGASLLPSGLGGGFEQARTLLDHFDQQVLLRGDMRIEGGA